MQQTWPQTPTLCRAFLRGSWRLQRPSSGSSWRPRPQRAALHTQARAEAAAAAAAGTGAAAPLPLGVGLLYAVSAAPQHTFPGHKECAERVPAILDALAAEQLAASARPGQVAELTGFREATLEEVLAVHDRQYTGAIERLSARGKGTTQIDASPTYVTPSSYQDALRAVGAVLALVDAVMVAAPCSTQQAQQAAQQLAPSAFALCRPPGHHSLPKEGMGFCLFNNAAIASRYAQQQHGVKKVAIFDWDVHHGNGTNDIFWEDPDVLFISTHQTGLWPNTGKVTEVGKGDGEGASINIPLPGDSGHEALLAAYDEVVEPALRRFQPELLIISAGYDAHWRDPLAGLQLRSATYNLLAARVRRLAEELCQGRLVLLLEGGYDLKGLGDSVVNSFLGLLGEGPRDAFNPDLLRDEPLDKVRAVISEAQRLHRL